MSQVRQQDEHGTDRPQGENASEKHSVVKPLHAGALILPAYGSDPSFGTAQLANLLSRPQFDVVSLNAVIRR
jgi:hypothetical protein